MSLFRFVFRPLCQCVQRSGDILSLLSRCKNVYFFFSARLGFENSGGSGGGAI